MAIGVAAAIAAIWSTTYEVQTLSASMELQTVGRCVCVGPYAVAESFPVQHICRGVEYCWPAGATEAD